MKKTLLVLTLSLIIATSSFAGSSAGKTCKRSSDKKIEGSSAGKTCVINPDHNNFNGSAGGRTCKNLK